MTGICLLNHDLCGGELRSGKRDPFRSLIHGVGVIRVRLGSCKVALWDG
jgi:hypothetical protein